MGEATLRHHPIIVALHWLTALIVALSVFLVLGRDWLDGDPFRQWLLNLHRLLGLMVLCMTLARLVCRPLLGAAEVNPDLPPLMARLAGLTHGSLYLLLLALPLLGWAQWSASGKALQLFGVLSLAPLLGSNRDLAETLGAWHQGLAWLLVGLIATHALAALWHHFGRGDQVLRSMLPLRLGGRSRAGRYPSPTGLTGDMAPSVQSHA